jgi:hypothetical protein
MEYFGLVFFAAALLAGFGWLGRLVARAERNQGSLHGGGYESALPYVP